MKYQIGDILTSPYPNDSSVGLVVEQVESYESNPFRTKLYPYGYYKVLVLEDNEYMNWDAEWAMKYSQKIA